MQWRRGKRQPYSWSRWFALFPTNVGQSEDESFWVWLEWYEYRVPANHGCYWEVRLKGQATIFMMELGCGGE